MSMPNESSGERSFANNVRPHVGRDDQPHLATAQRMYAYDEDSFVAELNEAFK